MTTEDILHILLALASLLVGAHVCGQLFSLFRQARVIGEIVGGLILGPTLLGEFFPGVYQYLFKGNAATQVILSGIYQSGLFLLMFCSGFEMKSHLKSSERKTALINTFFGILIPLGAAVLVSDRMDFSQLLGTAQSSSACKIVFGIAVAVTSIPVISRILTDLGFLDTKFGRIVILSAVLEDVILYVLLAIALSLVNRPGHDFVGLAGLLNLTPGHWTFWLYHTVSTVGFLLVSLFAGPRVLQGIQNHRWNILGMTNPIAFQIVFMLLLTGIAILLGITPMFGAFVAGLISGRVKGKTEDIQKTIRTFSFAFFIPLYFAMVGLKLNLLKDFDGMFFLGFLLFSCIIKVISVFIASKTAGETTWGSWNLAVAMNARGGPGIVLASVALDAAIINQNFYASLVMLAIVTSMLAGYWFNLVHRRKWELM